MNDTTPIPIHPIYTIGHGDRALTEVIALLQRYQIAFLIDVRDAATAVTNPLFVKTALATALQPHGIRYVDLGATLGAGAVDDAAYQQALGRLRTAFTQQQRVALLGAAVDPAACHRSQRIGVALTGWQIPVVHIDEQGALQPQGNDNSHSHEKADSVAVRMPTVAPTPAISAETPSAVLKRVFGYDEFRPLQAQIVENVLARRDTLVIMPTGGGKSLCYQLPALLMDGLTLVVSPLIALMQDQVDGLRQLGVAAAFLNSTLSAAAYNATLMQARSGGIKLLYMAPETLLRPESLDLLANCRLQAIAIDEAHCISQWGNDFRPEYRQLVTVRRRFPAAVCLALTATATPRVQQDITATLDLRNENIFVASFDRPNLFIGIQPKVDTVRQILDFLAAHAEQNGIIYCSTQRHVDDLTRTLQEKGLSARPYHAGLDKTVREQNQRAFMVDDARIMVATIAFGMGVDKPDVRFVLHIDLPQDVENYYQQIGRAGRDGDRADCLLLFGYGDVQTIQHFIRQGAEGEQAGRRARLQTLVNWAETAGCRRRPLLAYFGEEYETENCAMCDNCAPATTAQVELTEAAQKFLSCVVRTGQKFGLGHVINVLRGSRAQSVLKWGHEKLTTYGIGQAWSEAAWKHLAQQFLHGGLLAHEMTHGTVSITEKGWGVLRGQEQFWGTQLAPPPSVVAGEPATFQLALVERLRAKRKALADTAGLPPYMIFADRSLQEMATYLPHSAESFGAMHGVGRAKVEQYAEPFLTLIRAYCQEQNLQERPKAAHAAPRLTLGKARHEEVGERFAAGQSLDEIAEAFLVKRQTVVANLVKYAEAGHPVDGARLQSQSTLPPDQQGAVLAAFASLGDQYLRPIFDALNQTVDYDELHLLRLVYRLQKDAG